MTATMLPSLAPLLWRYRETAGRRHRAISAERLVPAGNRVAHAIGIAAVGAGSCLCVEAAIRAM